MSEVMICRGSSGGDEKKKVFKREIIEDSMIWTVPDIINNEVYVRVFGAGAYIDPTKTNNGWAGGGSGWLNNGTVKLIKGGSVTITVGKNGGESTSFGSLLIANGGYILSGGSSGSEQYTAYKSYIHDAFQFGGSTSIRDVSWGTLFEGSNGGVWGGGGGSDEGAGGGDGGKYGGGGGAGYGAGGRGGTYGGNGGNETVQAKNGTNTIGWTNVDKDISTGEYITGPGLAGSYPNGNRYQRGGGGFGGCGGSVDYSIDAWGYGGGGYCGNSWGYGGGGYGKGADTYRQGGAGYFTPSNNYNGAGWGKYGYGMECSHNNIIHNAGPGVCVIEYYVWEDVKSK